MFTLFGIWKPREAKKTWTTFEVLDFETYRNQKG